MSWVRQILVGGAIALSCVAQLLSAPMAQAQTGVDSTIGSRTRLEEVTIVGSKEAIRALSGSAAYLDTDDIRTHSYDDINRALRRVPGVYLRGEDGFGLFPNISLRGVDPGRSGKVTIMEDGVLTAPAPYSAPSAYYSPATGRMHAIEVLKGSSQIEYGPHTTGGAINYLSTPIPSASERYLKISGGSDADFRSHTYVGDTVELGGGRFGYLFENVYRANDGFKKIDEVPGFSDRKNTGFERVEPLWKLSWEPNSATPQRFEAKFGYTALNANETYLGLSREDFAEKPFRRYAASRFDNIHTEHYRSLLRHTAQLTPALTLTTSGYYNHFQRNWFKLHQLRGPTVSLSEALVDPIGLAILKGEAAGTLRYRNNNREYYLAGFDTVADYEFGFGESTHNLKMGFRLHQDRIRRNQTNEDFTQLADGSFTLRTGLGTGSGGNRRQFSRAYALFARDEITLGELTVTPGIRIEHIDYSFEDYVSGESGRNDINVFAPGLGVHLALTEAFSVFGGVHRGYSVPGPRANIKTGINEESSVGTEFGARFDDGRGARAKAVLFLTNFNNLIVADNVGAGGTGDTESAGDINVVGGEFILGFDPGTRYGWGFRNSYYATFTVTDAELDGDANSGDPESIFSGGKDGNDVPYVPKFQFAVGGGVEKGAFGLFVDTSYVGSTFATASNVDNLINPNNGSLDARFGKTDAHFVVDVSAHWQVHDGMKLFANVHNLFDEVYIVSRHPHGPRPGKPFTALGGVELMF